jgi:hypothetical protein
MDRSVSAFRRRMHEAHAMAGGTISSRRDKGADRPVGGADENQCMRRGAVPLAERPLSPSFRDAHSRTRNPGPFAAGFREGASRNDVAKPVATRQRPPPASCCTCAHAMLAKPRFLRCRCVSHWSEIEVPLEFQGLGSLALHCGDGFPLGV